MIYAICKLVRVSENAADAKNQESIYLPFAANASLENGMQELRST